MLLKVGIRVYALIVKPFRRRANADILALVRSIRACRGGKTYKLTVPLPAPGKLFWSVTVYDAETRSQIATDQGKAALRSVFELKGESGNSVDLYFGPK